jgi:hypothetical protein
LAQPVTGPGALTWSWRGARHALAALAGELEQRDVAVSAMRAYPSVGLLLLTCGVVVWCYARMLSWRLDGQMTTWPAADAYGAARKLADSTQHGQ